jgi:hypothetical protein
MNWLVIAALIPSLVSLPQQGMQPGPGTPHSTGAANTIALSHSATSSTLTCSDTCGAFSLGFTAASTDLLIIFAFGDDNAHISSMTGGSGTWVFPANCSQYLATGSAGATSCAYVFLTGTATTVTATFNTTGGSQVLMARDYSRTTGSWTAETVPAGTTSTACGASATPCATPNVTLTGGGVNELVISSMSVSRTGCSVSTPFGNFSAPGGDGIGDHINTTSGTGGSFLQGSSCPTGSNGDAAMISIAFY